jgi:hypothetical protein
VIVLYIVKLNILYKGFRIYCQQAAKHVTNAQIFNGFLFIFFNEHKKKSEIVHLDWEKLIFNL